MWEVVMNRTEWLTRLEELLPMDGTFAAFSVNWDVLGVVGMYAFAAGWLMYRWSAHRRRPGRSRAFGGGMWVLGLFVRLLVSVAFLAFGILLALARAEGRSAYFYSRHL
jgi:hypothetical protein